MTSNLYDTLGISQNATTDEIRKAYKKRALQTHPDRLGPGVSDQEKRESEELFRKVNNAYEVLRDPQNRRLYDQCGVWPPTEPNMPDPGRHGSHHPPTGYPSGSRNTFFDPWGHHRPFAFTDPFALFDSIFDDMFPDPHRHNASSFAPDLSRMMNDDFFFPRHGFGPRLSDISAFPSFYDHPSLTAAAHGRLERSDGSRHPGQSGNGTGGFQWYSESHHSTTVNGVTQSTHRRRDWNGNLHETCTYPDGRKITTVNGVEQSHNPPPPPHAIAGSSPHSSGALPMIPHEHRQRYFDPYSTQRPDRNGHSEVKDPWSWWRGRDH